MRSEEYLGMRLDALRRLGMVSLRNYLKSRHWSHLADGRIAAIYRSPKTPPIDIRIPLASSYSDYGERIGDAITTIAESEDRKPFEVFTDITLPPSDVMRFSCAESDTVA